MSVEISDYYVWKMSMAERWDAQTSRLVACT